MGESNSTAKGLSDDEVMNAIEKAEPYVFPSVMAGKIEAGTITATCFNVINAESQVLATLTTTDDGRPGLALFQPGSKRARAELMLDADGPTLRLNNARGLDRLRLHLGDDGDPSIALMDSRGKFRVLLFLDGGRPHVVIIPRGARKRHVVIGTPLHKLPTLRAAWARAMRAARSNQRAKFQSAAMSAGFLSTETDRLWTFARRALGAQPTTPEDTLREAGVSSRRQAKYQRRMSSLLAGPA